jgi:putative transposase
MEDSVLTVSCKLVVTPQVSQEIDATLQAFADACNWMNATVDPKVTGRIKIHAEVYHPARTLFGLPANLTCQAITRVAGNRKTAKQDKKPVKGFKPTSLTLDYQIFKVNESDWTVDVTLLGRRVKGVALSIGQYQKDLLEGQKPTSATLVKRQDGTYHIQIQVKSKPPNPEATTYCLGVDLGRTDIAHTSQGESFCGQQLTQLRDKRSKQRAQLQHKASKGTRSTRRRVRQLQKRLSGRERRFQANINHTISHRLVKQAKANGWSIAIEELTGIRERTNQQPRNKTERRRSNSWAFYQLRQFLAYKCVRSGVPLVLVNPAYTSQTCHRCKSSHPIKGESYRSGKSFKCGHCGWQGDADLNGSVNISHLGASVTCPRGPWLACQLQGF